ncbi:class I adenylate-forming enzyme family protein [Tomitella fengzijianii]|uniref:Long-chain fatty acid--CoA ligase n=1 Tax=Tomitella fengzijianii TaxID=2597660 RepID=A0A516X3C4_9ACTN|nr:AMP-binding protein [Tomitella fengzijianii]QDQ97554.1 long-chain fatty acid--CoA ligase [Tomitella fengzijianii]
MTLALDFVRRGADEHGDGVAVRFGDRSLSFTQVDAFTDRIGAAFAEAGLRKGEHVGLLYGNSLWTVPVDFATMKCGLVRVPLNPRLAADEQARMLADADVSVIVHDAPSASRAQELLARIPGLRTLGMDCLPVDGVGGDVLDIRFAAADAPSVAIAPDDPMLLLYTSGTTGALKGVVHTHSTYGAVADNILANLLDPGPGSVMLHAASLIHASGTFVLPYFARGGTAAVLPGFEPRGFVEAIVRLRATEVNMVPTMLAMLLNSGAVDDADVSSLRTIIYGASPMPRPVLEQGIAVFGQKFCQYYGQTEAPLAITVLTKEDHRNSDLWGSCGKPSSDVRLRIADDRGEPVPAGEIGEMQVQAPFVMQGYYGADELNEQVRTADGWLRTRDMARSDAAGYVHLVDRSSDMIITGGYNVYPREVEDVLLRHPAVAECAVVGGPDEKWVEAVTAFVAVVPGADVTESELRELTRAHLAGYKVPKSVRFVDAIPKSPVGKLLRRELRAQLSDEAGRA